MDKKYGTLAGLLLIIVVITYSCTTTTNDNPKNINKPDTNTFDSINEIDTSNADITIYYPPECEAEGSDSIKIINRVYKYEGLTTE